MKFVPGAILGAAFGFRLVVDVQDPILFFGVWAGVSVLVGLLSAKYGLAFWEGIRDNVRWPWWR